MMITFLSFQVNEKIQSDGSKAFTRGKILTGLVCNGKNKKQTKSLQKGVGLEKEWHDH